jgi:hypothetical protein
MGRCRRGHGKHLITRCKTTPVEAIWRCEDSTPYDEAAQFENSVRTHGCRLVQCKFVLGGIRAGALGYADAWGHVWDVGGDTMSRPG